MGVQQDVLRTIGIGIESTKGTPVAPTHWFFRDDPFKLNPKKNHVQKKLGVGKMHQTFGVIGGSEWAEPEGAILVDANSYLPIQRLIHQTVTDSGAGPSYTHTGTFTTGEKKSGTIAVDDTDKGEERVAGFILKSIKESYRMNEIIKVELKGVGEFPEAGSFSYTPAWDIAEPLFIGEFVAIKFASNVAGLGAASVIEAQEADFEFDFGTSEAPSKTHSLGSRSLSRSYGGRTSGKATIKKFWLDSTYRTYFEDATEVAMSIKVENPDVDLGGGVHPSYERIFPKVTVNWTEDADVNDAQMESLEVEIHEGSDGSAQYPFKTILINGDAS